MSIGDRSMSILHFERKAMPVIPEHRPMYKICQILLILNISSTGVNRHLSVCTYLIGH